MEEIVDRLYTFLLLMLDRGQPEHGLPLPRNWSVPQIHHETVGMWEGYSHE